jgi:hypothetical protein
MLPVWEHETSHSCLMSASLDETWAALHAVTLGDAPLMRWLLFGRALPGQLTGQRRSGPNAQTPIVPSLRATGFTLLASEPPTDLQLGRAARFWRLYGDSTVRLRDADAFTAFSEPGFAKALIVFQLREHPEGTLLVTTTRVHGTDDVARRKFARYWRLVAPASGLTRRALLAAVRRRVERGSEPA